MKIREVETSSFRGLWFHIGSEFFTIISERSGWRKRIHPLKILAPHLHFQLRGFWAKFVNGNDEFSLELRNKVDLEGKLC